MHTRNLQLGCLLGVSVLQNLLLDYDTHNNLCVVLGNISEFWCQTLIYRFFFFNNGEILFFHLCGVLPASVVGKLAEK